MFSDLTKFPTTVRPKIFFTRLYFVINRHLVQVRLFGKDFEGWPFDAYIEILRIASQMLQSKRLWLLWGRCLHNICVSLGTHNISFTSDSVRRKVRFINNITVFAVRVSTQYDPFISSPGTGDTENMIPIHFIHGFITEKINPRNKF